MAFFVVLINASGTLLSSPDSLPVSKLLTSMVSRKNHQLVLYGGKGERL